MPELPEVETTRRGIAPLVTGSSIRHVAVRQPKLRYPVPEDLAARLQDQPLQEVARRAKYLLFRFPAGTLLVHLGMSGSLRLVVAGAEPQRHDHVDLGFDSGILRYRDPRRFGAMLWVEGDPAVHPLLAPLGIEPLDEAFSGRWLHRSTRGLRTPIKLAIMDSHRIVGVGNIYASESLFRARIDPTLPAGSIGLARCERLAGEIRDTLLAAIEAGGSSLRDFVGGDGKPGYFQQQYFAYGRDGEPCRVCATTIRRRIMGQRATFYCPSCQRR